MTTTWNWDDKEAEFEARIKGFLKDVEAAAFQALGNLIAGKSIGDKRRHINPEGISLEMEVLRSLGYVKWIDGNRQMGIEKNNIYWSTLNDYEITSEGREIYEAIVDARRKERYEAYQKNRIF